MVSTNRLFAGLTLALVLAVPSFAADTAAIPSDRPVTLNECIGYALTHHGSVLSAQQDVKGGSAGVTQARSGYMPKLNVGSYYNNNGRSINGISGNDNTTNGIQNSLEVTETLYDGGKTQTAISQAKSGEKVLSAQLDLAQQDRALKVTQAYFNALKAKHLADIANQTVAQSQEQLKLIKARIDAGDAAQVDVYPVEVQLANAKLTKIQRDNNARTAWNTLRNEMGLPNGPGLNIEDVQEPSTDTPALDDCIKTALAARPEVAKSAAQVDSAEAGLSQAKREVLPVPTAGVSYGVGLGGTNYSNQWTIGVGVSLNLFDGGAARAAVDSNRAKVDSVKILAEQSKKDITTEVEQSYLNLTSSLEQLTASKSNVTMAQKNLEVAKAKYQQGLAIPIEITNAQTSYSEALANNAQSLYDSYIARAQLNKAMGKKGYQE
jgi:TolC family type I secretion outer membrane protein